MLKPVQQQGLADGGGLDDVGDLAAAGLHLHTVFGQHAFAGDDVEFVAVQRFEQERAALVAMAVPVKTTKIFPADHGAIVARGYRGHAAVILAQFQGGRDGVRCRIGAGQ